MLVRKYLRVWKAWPLICGELVAAAVVSTVVYLVYDVANVSGIGLPNLLPVVLGAATAILLGFRNSAAYNRWTEAAGLWYGMANSCRILARMVVTFVDSHSHMPGHDPDRAALFKRELVYRILAWVAAVKQEARGGKVEESILKPLLSVEELDSVLGKQNPAAAIMLAIGHAVYDGMREGLFMGFDSFGLEGQLAQLGTISTNAVRLKDIPIPRQYTYFTKMMVWFFIIVLPFSFVAPLGGGETDVSWMVIPITVLVAFIFAIIEATGAVNEDPYASMSGIPLEAITRSIERDLRETLGETDLPEPVVPVDGVLH
jgi:putative membrane protein